jgi:hypothetical protein
MASTEIGVGCSVLDIQSLFIGSKLVESRILRSAAGVWGGYFTYPPTCCLNCCILANWNFIHGIQQYSFCKAQQVNEVKVRDPIVKTDVLRHSVKNL